MKQTRKGDARVGSGKIQNLINYTSVMKRGLTFIKLVYNFIMNSAVTVIINPTL